MHYMMPEKMTNKLAVIQCAVEGIVDETVARRLITICGGTTGAVYGKKGKRNLRKNISGYNRAANYYPWLVLVDLNSEYSCPPDLLTEWLPNKNPNLCLRIAIHEIEAWLLADKERVAKFFKVKLSTIPNDVELLSDPKQTMVNIARESRSRTIIADMVPSKKSHRTVGPAYNSRLIEFVSDTNSGWRPKIARNYSESLRSCINCIKNLINNS